MRLSLRMRPRMTRSDADDNDNTTARDIQSQKRWTRLEKQEE